MPRAHYIFGGEWIDDPVTAVQRWWTWWRAADEPLDLPAISRAVAEVIERQVRADPHAVASLSDTLHAIWRCVADDAP